MAGFLAGLFLFWAAYEGRGMPQNRKEPLRKTKRKAKKITTAPVSEPQVKMSKEELKRYQDRLLAGTGNDHDDPMMLAYAGDISSVPAMIAVLKRYPTGPDGMMICTKAHCIYALTMLTGQTFGDNAAAWEKWWEERRKPEESKKLQPVLGRKP